MESQMRVSIHAELWLREYSLCSALLPLVELLLPAGTTDGTVTEKNVFNIYCSFSFLHTFIP